MCHLTSDARFDSFAPVRLGRARWLVDGCDYMAAVAAAILKVLGRDPVFHVCYVPIPIFCSVSFFSEYF